MRNFWLSKIKVTTVTICNPGWLPHQQFIDVDTSLGHRFRCRVLEDGKLCSGRLDPEKSKGMDDLISEKEWEVVERYAEEMFFKAGLLKEKVWD